MHSAFPFHLFSSVGSVKFLSPITAVVQRHTLTHHFSPPLWSLKFLFWSHRNKGEGHHLFHHSENNLKDSISRTKTRNLPSFCHCSIAASAARANLRITSRLSWGHSDLSVLLAELRLYQKPSWRMKTVLLFGLGERTRFGSAFRYHETHRADSTDK